LIIDVRSRFIPSASVFCGQFANTAAATASRFSFTNYRARNFRIGESLCDALAEHIGGQHHENRTSLKLESATIPSKALTNGDKSESGLSVLSQRLSHRIEPRCVASIFSSFRIRAFSFGGVEAALHLLDRPSRSASPSRLVPSASA
jgi:hypothetical protein